LDENLGSKKFPEPLVEAGVTIELHSDHFDKGTPDLEWIPVVAQRGWTLVTLDGRLRYNKLEQIAILENDLAGFVLVGACGHAEKAQQFLRARRRVERVLRENAPPFIAKIYSDGAVKLWLKKVGTS
jgi:hypothetical protein